MKRALIASGLTVGVLTICLLASAAGMAIVGAAVGFAILYGFMYALAWVIVP